MSANEEEALNKGILYEYEETKKQLNLRRVQASQLADSFRRLAEALAYDPTKVAIETFPASIKLTHEPQFPASLFHAKTVADACEAIRQFEKRLAQLEERKKELGY